MKEAKSKGISLQTAPLILLLVLASLAQAQTLPTWTQLSPAGGLPSPRLAHSAVYDSATNRMIVFGGEVAQATPPALIVVNETWVLSNANGAGGTPVWTLLSTAGGPPSVRWAASVVYDSATNRMIVFGGQTTAAGSGGGLNTTVNDLWVLSNANGIGGTPAWTQLSPLGTPPSARAGAGAVYDPAANRMIIFGGNSPALATGDGGGNDVWVLSNANGLGSPPAWTQLLPTRFVPGVPSPRIGNSAVYDPASHRLIVFGGETASSPTGPLFDVNDIWVLSNATGLGGTPAWTQLFPTGPPPSARVAHTAVYDQASNRMIIFGGTTGTTEPTVTIPPINDVWVVSNATGLGGTPAWTQLFPTGGPPLGRLAHTAIYDPAANRMVAFGGVAFSGGIIAALFNDVWVLMSANGIPEITVAIAIKPGSAPPVPMNVTSQGRTPVAILSSATFDAPAMVDIASVTFGRTGNENSLAFCNASGEDVNGDGLLDLVCHFFTQTAGFVFADTMGVLKGKTIDGTSFTGTELVRTVP